MARRRVAVGASPFAVVDVGAFDRAEFVEAILPLIGRVLFAPIPVPTTPEAVLNTGAAATESAAEMADEDGAAVEAIDGRCDEGRTERSVNAPEATFKAAIPPR